jgi:hypothetical protein
MEDNLKMEWDDLDIDHTWQNWQDSIGPTELAQPSYICKCGEEFDTHAELMNHTAELNPVIESYELGRAGVGIERSAHEKTLKKLKKALDLLEGAIGAELITSSWEDDAKALLESAGRKQLETSRPWDWKPCGDGYEPFEETGFGD